MAAAALRAVVVVGVAGNVPVVIINVVYKLILVFHVANVVYDTVGVVVIVIIVLGGFDDVVWRGPAPSLQKMTLARKSQSDGTTSFPR